MKKNKNRGCDSTPGFIGFLARPEVALRPDNDRSITLGQLQSSQKTATLEKPMRQNIDEKWKTDPRRKALVKKLGSERLADGMRVEINWLLLTHKGKPIPLKEFQFVEDYQAWIESGLAEVNGEVVRIVGSDSYAVFFEKQRKNGAMGGRPIVYRNPEKPRKTQNNPTITQTKPENPSSSSSSSYYKELRKEEKSGPGPDESQAIVPDGPIGQEIVGEFYARWRERYHKRAPLLDADRKQLKRLAESLGLNDAKSLIRRYLSMDEAWFKTKSHDVSTLMSNLPKIQAGETKLVRFAVPD